MAPPPATIGTHSGTFHCDEALACYLLRLTPQFKGAAICRTRDAARLAELPIVVDVGGEYDPARHRYDHHQRGFSTTFSDKHPIKLSSAGLVYKHFGREIVAQVAPDAASADVLYQRMYTKFVEGLDAIDNGVSQYDGKPLYENNTHLSARVARLNPAWNEECDEAEVQRRFEQAVELTGSEFMQVLRRMASSWLPARVLVETALKERESVHGSGQIMRLSQYTEWQGHFFDLEQSICGPRAKPVLYLLHQDQAGKWRVAAVPEAAGSFASRKALPEAWRGVRDEALSKLSGIPGCIFVHAAGFIGANETYEGALAMAVHALK